MALHTFRTASQHVRYFLVLSVAFNLFFATTYPLYSGIAAFGGWTAVISGLSPVWQWRVLLVVFRAVSYYLSLLLLSVEMRPFFGSGSPEALTRAPTYYSDSISAPLRAACLARALNHSRIDKHFERGTEYVVKTEGVW